MPITKRYKYTGHSGNNKKGIYKESFYQRFRHIRERCTYPSNKDYSRYGKVGITFGWDTYVDFKKDMHKSFQEHVKIHGEKKYYS